MCSAMSKPTLTVTKDFTKQFNEVIARFKSDAVVVGIPEDKTDRKEVGEINNATLLALNHFGSEKLGIPPRQPLTIGIRNAQPAIAEQFKIAAQSALSAGPKALTQYYERAGSIASSAVKKVINDQEGIQAPAPSTLKARQYLTKAGFKGTKALVVTGQMRNAITWVVKSLWGK
jgi:hypothetical protein